MMENIRSPFVNPAEIRVEGEESPIKWEVDDEVQSELDEHVHEHEQTFSFEEEAIEDELPLEIKALIDTSKESEIFNQESNEEETPFSFEVEKGEEEREIHEYEIISEANEEFIDMLNEEDEVDNLGIESELKGSEISKARGLNLQYMGTLMWANHISEIRDLLKKVTGRDIQNGTDYIVLVNAVAEYQKARKLKGVVSGALSPLTWSTMQDELGWLHYNKPVKIDVKKAAEANNHYEKKIWGSQKFAILQYFAVLGFIKHAVPLNNRYFSLIVARWQVQFPDGSKADGILGPNTWKRISPLLSSTSKVTNKWADLMKGSEPGKSTPLVHGKETFEQIAKAIETAKNEKHYIYIMGWMMDIRTPLLNGKTMHSYLFDAVKRGVQVRVLIWENPIYVYKNLEAESAINALADTSGKQTALMVRDNFTFGTERVKSTVQALKTIIALTAKKIETLLAFLAGVTGSPFLLPKMLAWQKMKASINAIQNEGSHHEKVVVVKGEDGLIGFCGGIDINSNRLDGKVDDKGRSESLHDIHCEIHGRAALPLLKRFVDRWEIYKEMKGTTAHPYAHIPLRADVFNDASVQKGANNSQVRIINTYNHPRNPKPKLRTVRETILAAIEKAERSIHIECQYMISTVIARKLNQKLSDPKFKIYLISQDDEFAGSDLQFPKYFRGQFIEALLKERPDAIKNKQVHFRILDPNFPASGHHSLHSKILIADDELAIVGSQNTSSRSLTFDSETAAVILNTEKFSKSFVSDLFAKLNYDVIVHPKPVGAVTRTVTYIPNPNTNPDLDELVESEAKDLLKGPVGVAIGAANLTPAVFAFIKSIPEIKKFAVSVLDPDDQTDVIQKEYEPAQEIIDNLIAEEVITNRIDSSVHYLFPEEYTVSEQPLESFSEEFAEDESQLLFGGETRLPPSLNNKATLLNKKNVQASGISLDQLTSLLSKWVNFDEIRNSLSGLNSNANQKYAIDGGGVDAVFTEAVCQFQQKHFLDKKEHDGILGASTLDTLGFEKHGLRSKLNSSGYYGQQQLNQISSAVSNATNGEFTSSNWFQYIVKPAWLGVKISDGIHVLLYRKLKEAEAWLLSQPQYQGKTPAQLGEALGLRGIRFSGARLSSEKQAMHGVGLAIDIDGHGNPWIGAGWIRHDPVKLGERTRILELLKKTSGENLPGRNIFAYLHSISESNGTDTNQAWSTLQQRNTEFISYLKTNTAELTYWRQSASFDNRDPLRGFLHLHKDLVYALRQHAGLAWGAIDFGPNASGDIMHFDLRTQGVGKIIAKHMGGYIPKAGHPAVQSELDVYEIDAVESEAGNEWEFHEELDESEYAEELTMELAENEIQ